MMQPQYQMAYGAHMVRAANGQTLLEPVGGAFSQRTVGACSAAPHVPHSKPLCERAGALTDALTTARVTQMPPMQPMRPGPGQYLAMGAPPRGAFQPGFPQGGYVQMGAGAPMMGVPGAAMAAGQARPIGGGPPGAYNMYQPAPGAPRPPGGIQPIPPGGMRPISGGTPGGAMAIPGKGAGGGGGATVTAAAATPPAPTAQRRAGSSAIKIVDPDTEKEIEMPPQSKPPPTVTTPADGSPAAATDAAATPADGAAPAPLSAAAPASTAEPPSANATPAAAVEAAAPPRTAAPTGDKKAVDVTDPAPPVKEAPQKAPSAAVPITAPPPADAKSEPKAAPEAAAANAAVEAALVAPTAAMSLGGAAAEDDGDDDWETKDESELLIDTKPDMSKPPGIGDAVSLRPGGANMGAFSSASKASPGNSSGKKCYEKDFLLQFAKFFNERPSSLPEMEIIVIGPGGEALGPAKGKGVPAAGGPPGLGSNPDEWRRVSGGRGGGDMRGGGRGGQPFDPRDPRNNQYQKGAPGGKDGRKGKDGKMAGPSRGFSNFDVKPLEESENAWKPNAKSKEEVDALEKLLRTTKGLLNKFTPEKFEKLTDQFLELEITCRTDMIAIIDLVFDKALFEPIFGFMYSQLCVRCAEKFPEFPDENNPEAKPHTFKRLLLNKCQEEFEKENAVDAEIAKLPEDSDPAVKEQIRKKAKSRMLGNIRFIGELYKSKMLTEKIMHECVIKLLGDVQNPDLDEVECLVKLLTAIGKLIDHPKSKQHMDAYFQRIRDMSTHEGLPNRVRFMLQEVIELRRGQWKERKADPSLRPASTAAPAAPPGRGGPAGGGGADRIMRGHGDVRNEMSSSRGGGGGGPPSRGAPLGQQQGQQQLGSRGGKGGESPAPRGGKGGEAGGSGAPSAPSAPAAPPPFSEDQIKKKLEDNFEEFTNVGDAKELVACLNELTPRLPAGRSESLGLTLISIALPKACDARTETPRDRVCEMLGPLAAAKLLSASELQTHFRDSLEFLEDEVVDVPHIAHYYSCFLASAVAANLMPLATVATALEPLIDATLVKPDAAYAGQAGAAWMVVETVRQLRSLDAVGEEGAKTMYAAAKLDLLKLLPADARSQQTAADLLVAGGIEFVDPAMGESVRAAEAAASAQAAQAALESLERYLSSGVLVPSAAMAEGAAEEGDEADPELEGVSKAIDEQVGPPENESGDALARVVMRCVLHATCEGNDPPSATKICKQIERCAKLLKKVTQSSAAPKRLVKQAGCLYEVQAFCHAKAWPAGLMKKLFYNLYETDVVFEDAYGVWREDVNDSTPGKDKALFQVRAHTRLLSRRPLPPPAASHSPFVSNSFPCAQVNEFLQWLDEAVEDDGEED